MAHDHKHHHHADGSDCDCDHDAGPVIDSATAIDPITGGQCHEDDGGEATGGSSPYAGAGH